MFHPEAENPVHDSHQSAPVSNPFSPEEVATLQADDRAAARNIVVLLTVLFIAGLVGYSLISISIRVSQG